MKKNLLLLLLLVLLAIAVWFGRSFGSDSKSSSIDVSDREFAIENVEDVQRIKLTRRTGAVIDLKKEGKDWFVGKKNKKVSNNIMSNLLGVIKSIQIKFIPPAQFNEKIINEINRIGTQVDIYDKGDNLLKSYFVGGNVPDGGTYYIMQGKTQPYVMERKVGYGGVRDLFIYREEEIYDKAIWNIDTKQIKSVSVDYPKDKTESFKIQKTNEAFIIDPLYKTTRRIPTRADQDLIKAYVDGFDVIYSESNENDNKLFSQLKELIPFSIMSFELEDGTSKTIKLYPVNQFLDEHEEMTPMEKANLLYLERFFVVTDWGDLYAAQKRLILKLFRGYSYFHDR